VPGPIIQTSHTTTAICGNAISNLLFPNLTTLRSKTPESIGTKIGVNTSATSL